MSETDEARPEGGQAATKKRGGGLNTMLLADLKAMASGLGVSGAGSMKKADLVNAIKAAQSGGQSRQDKPQQKAEPSPEQKQDQAPKGSQSKGSQPKDKQPDQGKQDQGKQQQDQGKQPPDDQGDGSNRSRRRRGRDRGRGTTGNRNEPDTTVLEDDVLVPAAGIVDVLDNYAFVRTSGYLAGPDDVYLSLSLVRKFGLRRGDAVVGQVRQPREGERREKFNPMVRVDSVNGTDPDVARDRVEFEDLTPVHPEERLRMETTPDNLVGRVLDLAAPIGKGQRGLVVSPAEAGKTTLLQSVAASVTANNPECHLMVVLIDERPEEVTDFERTVKGEVIASTFDRPASDHTSVAELAIERAKRLVELGHDVVVLLDGLTRLGRAYHVTGQGSGRVFPGGIDPSALFPSKRFFGAARNIEDGGSLTVLATATVDSGSAMDEAIVEEFQGTANAEVRLSQDLAERRVFPAIDAARSGTRHEELLMGAEELDILRTLRGVLAGGTPRQAMGLVLDLLGRTQTNIELLMQVQRSTPRLPDPQD